MCTCNQLYRTIPKLEMNSRSKWMYFVLDPCHGPSMLYAWTNRNPHASPTIRSQYHIPPIRSKPLWAMRRPFTNFSPSEFRSNEFHAEKCVVSIIRTNPTPIEKTMRNENKFKIVRSLFVRFYKSLFDSKQKSVFGVESKVTQRRQGEKRNGTVWYWNVQKMCTEWICVWCGPGLSR